MTVYIRGVRLEACTDTEIEHHRQLASRWADESMTPEYTAQFICEAFLCKQEQRRRQTLGADGH